MGKGSRLKALFASKKKDIKLPSHTTTTAIGGQILGVKLYENNHIDILAEMAICHNLNNVSYIEKELYSNTLINGPSHVRDPKPEVLGHSNIIILISGDTIGLTELLDIYASCRYLNITHRIINNTLYVILGGSVLGYKYLFKTIRNQSNRILLAIKNALYDTPSIYYQDFIYNAIMHEKEFIPQEGKDTIMQQYFTTTSRYDILNSDSIGNLISILKSLNIYGENKFDIKDVLKMITITIHYKEISIRASHKISKNSIIIYIPKISCNITRREFISPCKYNKTYDEGKIYSILIADGNKTNVTTISGTLQYLGEILTRPYNNLITQGIDKEDAKSYLPLNTMTDIYVTYSLEQLIDTIENVKDKECKSLLNSIKEGLFIEKGFGYDMLRDQFKPEYELNNIENMTYDDIDEEV